MVNLVSAQDHNDYAGFQYFNKTEAGIGLGFGSFSTDNIRGYEKKVKNDQKSFSGETINGVIISGRAGLGVGLGVEFWDNGLFYPVFAHFFYDLKKADNTPFAYINLGEAFGTRYSTYYYERGKSGFLFTVGAGYKMKVAKSVQFEYELFYQYQAVQSNYKTYYDTVPTHFTTTDYKVPYNFAGFKIGVLFH
jgi:hypothetical protein